MNSKYFLTVFHESMQPLTFCLDDAGMEVLYLGRTEWHDKEAGIENNIRLPDALKMVSRGHCVLFRRGGIWYIRNNPKSVNGLVYGGHRINEKCLEDGDRFYIGDLKTNGCVLVFSCVQQSQAMAGGTGVNLESARQVVLGSKKMYTVGRSENCDIRINHPSVSRRHCIIIQEHGQWYISDTNSRNGVSVNGEQLYGRRLLKPMDRIRIAHVSMSFADGSLYVMEGSGGVSIQVEHLFKQVGSGKERRFITNDVSLTINPGEFVALIGGSGAGKTTLLNCLSGMTSYTGGKVRVGGELFSPRNKAIRSIIGYVPQNDIVYDDLTLERMLWYSAKLRMPADSTKQDLQDRIEEILKLVELTDRRNVKISSLSGGQRKRASMAVELLASPRLFFLDEPFSGLDPGTEKSLMQMLQKLAKSGRTVIMVTHSVQNLDLCDRVVCMGKGGLLCYSGNPKEAPAAFGKSSFTDIYDELNNRSRQWSDNWKRITNTASGPNSSLEVKFGEEKKKKQKKNISGLRQFTILSGRYAELTWRRRSRLLFLLFLPVVLTVFVGIAYEADGGLYRFLSTSGLTTFSRSSFPMTVGADTQKIFFTFACAAFWIGIFNSVQEISKERKIYQRERFTGVGCVPYLFSKVLIMVALCLVQAVIMLLLLKVLTHTTYYIVGAKNSINADLEVSLLNLISDTESITALGMWPEIFLTTFLTILCAMCLGLAVSSAVSNDMALVLCPVFLLPQILFAGVASTLSGVTKTISNFITSRWACIAYFCSTHVNDQYVSLKYSAGSWTKTEASVQTIIADYSKSHKYVFGQNPVISSWIVLFGMCIVFLVLAGLILALKDRPKGGRTKEMKRAAARQAGQRSAGR